MTPGDARKPADLRVGVDVGGTWLRAALLSGGRLRRTRLRKHPRWTLRSSLRRVFAAWRVGRVDRLVVGARGVWSLGERRRMARALRPLARDVHILPDLQLAFLSALDGKPGLLILAGTGSVSYGRGPDGRTARAGGIGPLLGDEGSAFWIGKQWVAGLPESVAWELAHDPDPVRATSALARQVLRRSRRDPRARRIADEAARRLAALALRAARRLAFRGKVPISWHGGVFRDPGFTAVFLRRLDPRFLPVPPAHAPEVYAAKSAKMEI